MITKIAINSISLHFDIPSDGCLFIFMIIRRASYWGYIYDSMHQRKDNHLDKLIMASTEAKAKWLPSSSKSESLNDIKWWSYHQQKVNTDSFWNPECDVKMLEFEAEGEAEKLFSGMESEWIGIKKKEPWWRKADCDLPLPHTSKTKKWLLVCDKGLASLNPEKEMYKNMETQTPNCQLSKAELLEALCRSQRRAREAEKAADEACNEKEHVITLFLKQASQIFAYKQCLYAVGGVADHSSSAILPGFYFSGTVEQTESLHTACDRIEFVGTGSRPDQPATCNSSIMDDNMYDSLIGSSSHTPPKTCLNTPSTHRACHTRDVMAETKEINYSSANTHLGSPISFSL
ncbi:hypothetical protein L2E82_31566 [Cichorium intybus]|uniref:Uncharacterized protein n=1 Tax=Cichorium intybus TaxID=13427 RepID=A0ACB9BDK4_CICIN|nr:hypothetical protein L2E82_31566 [Cichorium intybus]